MLFFSSVMLPATLSAASLLCGMQESGQQDCHGSVCWNTNSADHAGDFSETSRCLFQQVCDQAISDDTHHAAAIPQFTKGFAVAFIITKVFTGDTAGTQFRTPELEETVAPKNQPLFLLNSAFLN